MTRAMTVANYIEHLKPAVGRVQLQKLLYYVQGWSLAWTGQSLFEDELQAWDKGPVAPAVFHDEPAPVENLSADQQSIIAAVLQRYGHLSGAELIKRTHDERPWREAFAKGGRNCPISLDSLLREFTHQAIEGEGPDKPELSRKCESELDIRALTDEITKEWSEALEILSR